MPSPIHLHDHTFLGVTQSLCPQCLRLVPAKIISRRGRVYFRKHCPEHGLREDFVCSDVTQFDRMEFNTPGRVPAHVGVEPSRGCPFDCGLCTEHEQHTCIGLVEITESCNLTCPMCYAASAPGGKHLSLDDCKRAIDRLVEVEGRPEVLQLSGGEPTIHPEFLRILDYACAQPIDMVMVNTNGLRLARDQRFLEQVAEYHKRMEVYLQFDGFRDSTYQSLRGEAISQAKLAAVEALGKAGVHVILVATLQPGVNDGEIGAIVKFAVERPWVTGVSFQPATYSGRHVTPEDLERRLTFPDVIAAIAEQTSGMFRTDDFMPLPCAHPNCHSLTYAYRGGGQVVPLTRFIDPAQNLDLLANGITFTRERARKLIETLMGRMACCPEGGCGGESSTSVGDSLRESMVELQTLTPALSRREREQKTLTPALSQGESGQELAGVAQEFFARALREDLSPRDVFRITVTSFLDAYNFDVRRVMKCCIHHVLPSGHVVPFCAYNVLYRNGHVPLPVLSVGDSLRESRPGALAGVLKSQTQ